jgi:predicted esterase
MALALLVSFQKQKQQRYCIRFTQAFLKAKAHDSKNRLAANIFKSGFSEGGII